MPAPQQQATLTYFWFVLDILGQGATGCVYKARHKKTGEFYAVKVFNQMSYMRPHSIQMREFDVLRKLDHDNIVRLLAVEEETSTRCNVLVMELCTGGSLYNVLDEPENAYGLEESEFFSVLHDIAAGLKHLREQGIVHRDIKPGNIMRYIADDGRSIYKLTDFGAARELEDEECFMSLYGTEEYLFPDVYERAVLRRPMGKQFGAEVDLWSLGVTLYHVATGQLPFRPYGGRKNREMMYRITTEKDSGVISGFQSTEGGEIEWRRELPETCRLSQGAMLLVTDLLAGLMESNVDVMWTFQKFFDETTDVCTRSKLHVFNVCSGTMLHVFVRPNDCYAKIQEKIAEQADIHTSNQVLILNNARLGNVVKPMQHVESYPKTTKDNPIILLYSSSADVPRLVPTTYPKVTQVVVRYTDFEADAHLARSVAAVVCMMYRLIEDSVRKQQLIHKSIKDIQSVQLEDIRHIQDYTNLFKSLMTETKKRLEHVTTFASFLLMMGAKACSNGTQAAIEAIHAKLTDLKKIFAEIDEMVAQANHYIDDYADKIVTKRELQIRWKSTLGCQEADRCGNVLAFPAVVRVKTSCVAKMKTKMDAVKEIRASFVHHRKLKSLSFSEEQIHNYDKRKLCQLYDNGRCLLDRHCLKNEQEVFNKAVRQYELIDGLVGTKVRRVESQIMTATEKLNSFRPQLDRIQNDLEQLLDQIKDDCQQEKTSPLAHHESKKSELDKEARRNSSQPHISVEPLLRLQEEMAELQEMIKKNHSFTLQLDREETLCI